MMMVMMVVMMVVAVISGDVPLLLLLASVADGVAVVKRLHYHKPLSPKH